MSGSERDRPPATSRSSTSQTAGTEAFHREPDGALASEITGQRSGYFSFAFVDIRSARFGARLPSQRSAEPLRPRSRDAVSEFETFDAFIATSPSVNGGWRRFPLVIGESRPARGRQRRSCYPLMPQVIWTRLTGRSISTSSGGSSDSTRLRVVADRLHPPHDGHPGTPASPYRDMYGWRSRPWRAFAGLEAFGYSF